MEYESVRIWEGKTEYGRTCSAAMRMGRGSGGGVGIVSPRKYVCLWPQLNALKEIWPYMEGEAIGGNGYCWQGNTSLLFLTCCNGIRQVINCKGNFLPFCTHFLLPLPAITHTHIPSCTCTGSVCCIKQCQREGCGKIPWPLRERECDTSAAAEEIQLRGSEGAPKERSFVNYSWFLAWKQ